MNVHGSPPPPAEPRLRCPDCRAPLPDRPRACERCGLLLTGPTAQRLWWIDEELTALDDRRQRLRGERADLVRRLREESKPSGAPAAPADFPGGPHPAALGPPPSARSGEVTERSAQNVILGLGGLLVGVAALVFAVWTWSDMGTGTRASVLVATTLLFAGLAHPLLRRGLRATAETFGTLAAVLLCVDALALWALSDGLADGPAYAAAALAVISTLMLLYPLAVPLRAPRIVAVLLAQPVPFLLVVSAPFPGRWSWLAATVAVTALADVLLVRRLGTPRPGVPVRTLRVTAIVLWAFAMAVPVLALATGPRSIEPPHFWGAATALLVAGATGLLLAGAPARSGTKAPAVQTVLGLLSLGLVPLAAGPFPPPVFPRLPGAWSTDSGLASSSALEVFGMSHPGAGPSLALAFLAAVVVGAVLAAGTVAVLRRDLLLPAVALVAPATMPAIPLLLGLPHAVAVVWTLLVGAALVLGALLLRRDHLAWVPATTGTATVLTGLYWSLPALYTSMAALLLVGATALTVAVTPGRLGGTRPDGPGRAVYTAGVVLWALPVVVGCLFMITVPLGGVPDQPRGGLLAALALVSGATALVFGRVPNPFTRDAPGGLGGFDYRPAFTVAGLLLLPAAPLLTGPDSSPVLSVFSGAHAPWTATVSVLLDPAHSVLGLPAPAGAATAVGTAFGVVLAGALAVAVGALGRVPWMLPVASGASSGALARPKKEFPYCALLRKLSSIAQRGPARVRLSTDENAASVPLGRRAAGQVSAEHALVRRDWTLGAAALVAPPALVPLPVMLGLPFAVALAWAGAVGSALLLVSALTRDARTNWVPGLTGLLTLLLGLGWSLAEPYTHTAVLMLVSVVGAVTAASARTPVPAAGATALATIATGGFALTLPLALDVAPEFAALAPIAMVAGVVAAAPRLRRPLLQAAEIPATLWAAAALTVSVVAGARPGLVALALAVVGVIALAGAVRPHRRWLAVVGGLLMLAALWTVLAAWHVSTPEAYTLPPAIAALVIGWEWIRKARTPPSSWAAHGGGLALLFLPSVAVLLSDSGMAWRVPAVLAVGLAVVVWGLRRRLQAALLVGAAALLLASLRAFGPPLWDLTLLLPNWVPFAVAGAALLAVGARYESHLARLRGLGRMVSSMR